MALADTALLIIDVQNDFCPGGALAVAGGDAVVPVLNLQIAAAVSRAWPVYASRDWHPPGTAHFAPSGPWPVHCVRDTPGAAFHPDLRLPHDAIIVTKGQHPVDDGYSAFEGKVAGGGTLLDDLRRRGITRLIVGGLATDYCVKASVLDALTHGFAVTVVTDAIAAVDLAPLDGARALDTMRQAGATLSADAGPTR